MAISKARYNLYYEHWRTITAEYNFVAVEKYSAESSQNSYVVVENDGLKKKKPIGLLAGWILYSVFIN